MKKTDLTHCNVRVCGPYQPGCLIDKYSRPFTYDNSNLNRPILGTGLVVDGHPILAPIVLNKKGCLVGRLV